MRSSLVLATKRFLTILALAASLSAKGDLSVINISGLPGTGNMLGLAFVPPQDVFYLSRGSEYGSRNFIHTIDRQGNLLRSWDWSAAVGTPSIPLSLSYDGNSGHLFVTAGVEADGETHLFEMSMDGTTIFRDDVVSAYGDGLHVNSDGIWIARFSNDTITHLSFERTFLEEFLVGGFKGFNGPVDLASSFVDGFFVLDHFGRQIVETDDNGTVIRILSTACFGNGRGLAMDSYTPSGEVFVQINNVSIYIVSGDWCSCREPLWICDGDVDGDGQVNPVDAGLVQAAYGTADGDNLCQFDIDCSGVIDPIDTGIVQSLFGTCEPPRDACP